MSSKEKQMRPPRPKEQLFPPPDVVELLKQLDEPHRVNRGLERRGEVNLEDPLTKILAASLWTKLIPR